MSFELRDYQLKARGMIIESYRSGKRSPCLVAPCGYGKCLGKNTPVLMLDGSIKLSQDIVKNDKIMGPDSKPRNVIGVCKGVSELYQVTPIKGDSYIVNDSHILSLRITGSNKISIATYDNNRARGGDIVNISIKDYIRSSLSFKNMAKGWRAGVDFPAKNIEIDPYILGLWLGDGCSRQAMITGSDTEIISSWLSFAKNNNLKYKRVTEKGNCISIRLSSKTHQKSNVLRDFLKNQNLILNKHIPHKYKTSSRHDRLELLAGILDTDGYYNNRGYDIVLKQKQFADDLVYLARSLGFAAYTKPCIKTIKSINFAGQYYRTYISGDLHQVPCRVKRRKAHKINNHRNVLNVGISVKSVGVGEYFGFEIDGDHLFMLGDFTVTHNTSQAADICITTALKGNRATFLAPRRNLVLQTDLSFREKGIDCSVLMSQCAYNANPPITIASVDTVVAQLRRESRWTSNAENALKLTNLLIVDEAHTFASTERAKLINDFLDGAYGPKKLVLSMTASPCLTGGGGLGGICDDLIVPTTWMDLIKSGNLLQPHYYSGDKPDLSGVSSTAGDHNQKQLGEKYDSTIMGCVIKNWQKIAPGTTTVVFTPTRANAQHLVDEFTRINVVAAYLDANTDDDARRAIFNGLSNGSITVVCQVGIISMGTDIPRFQTVVMATATKSIAKWIQAVGRPARPFAGQDHFNVIDHGGMTNDPKMGPVEYINDWCLAEKEKIQDRIEQRKKEKEEPKDIDCQECSRVYKAAAVCPHCGFKRKQKSEKMEVHQMDLKRVIRKPGKTKVQKKGDKQKIWENALYTAKYRGCNVGSAAHIYKAKTGVWPRGLNMMPQWSEWKKSASDFLQEQKNA